MELIIEIIKFIIYTTLIVLISKYILVNLLRNLAESLNLKPKIVGNIAGIATSIPELITVSLGSITGLAYTGIYTVLSSNIINLLLYLSSVLYNRNIKLLRNTAIKIDLLLVICTILIPIVLINMGEESSLLLVVIFLILFILFSLINNKTHNYYLLKYEKKIEESILEEEKYKRNKAKLIVKYSIYILIVGVFLFIIGNLLSDSLETLCIQFNIPELIMGILLGLVTSIPELITFFESQTNSKSNNEVGIVEATNNLFTSNVLNLFIIYSIGIILLKIFQ